MAETPKGPFDPDEQKNMPLDAEEVAGDAVKSERFFNIPGPILALIFIMGVLYAVQAWITSPEIAEWLAVEFGFSPAHYNYPLGEQDLAWAWTPVTYSFLHASVEHFLFNALWLAAFGTPVIIRIGGLRFALFWCVSAAVAAFTHALFHWAQPTLLVGASGVISALMGAACRFAFGQGRSGFRSDERVLHEPRLSVLEAFSQKTVRVFILVFFIGNALIALGIPLIGDPGGVVAWDAHLGGFVVGFFFFALFDLPGGRLGRNIP